LNPGFALIACAEFLISPGFIDALARRSDSMSRLCIPASILCMLLPVFGSVQAAAEPLPVHTLSLAQAQSLGVGLQVVGPVRPAVIAGLVAEVAVPPDRLHLVSAPVAARIEQLNVSVGDRVRRGQVLARLASPELAGAYRALLQAHAHAQLAQGNLARDQKLLDEGIISASRLASTRAAALEARAALSESRQVLALAGVDERTVKAILAHASGNSSGVSATAEMPVRAPVDGIVLAREASLGQRVGQSTPLFRLAQDGQRVLMIHVPRDRIAAVRPGARVLVSGRQIATVQTLGASVDPVNQTVLVRAPIDESAPGLRIGEIVEVSIQLPAADDGRAVTVPNSALIRVDGASYLFVERPKGLQPLRVSLLYEGLEESLVDARLPAGTRIAVSGTAALKAALLAPGVQ
jgi:cobalt-zinc-cadmium efflux system membrane fusion protein